MTTMLPVANIFSPCAKILQAGFPYQGAPLKPNANLRAVPVPPYIMGGIPSTPAGGFPMFPVRPLPVSGGAGGYAI